ncbi:Fe2+-dependent dioxygenase [Phenylobacterium sp.]|uniref:Fe2+-dependent dioxygenase n=1 Tax=Phenylobacterium sp. TaxID=1871053 RepID=UPI002DF31D69|nr:Fe2+-dependent dioxygenase [Phenylobacterium sp.]
MLIVEQVLHGEDLARVRSALDGAAFTDGKVSAMGSAREVKRNAEAADASLAELRRFVKQTLGANGKVSGYARPVRWAPLIFSRYGPGDAYGEHVDAPFMRADDGAEMRADLSFTLFLDDPASYEGGELVLDSQRRPQPIKLAAGDAILYPTSVLHAVAPVRSGARRAAVGWIESRIRDAEQRLLLHELELGVAALPHDANRRRLTAVFANLMKMWG